MVFDCVDTMHSLCQTGAEIEGKLDLVPSGLESYGSENPPELDVPSALNVLADSVAAVDDSKANGSCSMPIFQPAAIVRLQDILRRGGDDLD